MSRTATGRKVWMFFMVSKDCGNSLASLKAAAEKQAEEPGNASVLIQPGKM
jgi:hypothetical protein